MIKELDCPRCDFEFEVDEFNNDGECPNCKNEYYFYEECTQDYSDCWTATEWQFYE